MFLAVHGQDHTSVADSKYNIADLHETQGDVEEAKKLFLECEQIYAEVYGQDHSETLDAARRAQNVGQEEEEEEEEKDSACCVSCCVS